MPAFDAHRPPDAGVIGDCVHCGFCLPTCPTYLLWGREADSPRGRIVLMDEGLRAGSVLSPEMVTHFDRCLGCMACVSACPSGVRFDQLIEATRMQVERNHRRAPADLAWRRLVLAVVTRPGVFAAAAPALSAARRIGLDRALQHPGLRRRFPRLAALAGLLPPAVGPPARHPAMVPAQGQQPARARVGLLLGCVNRALFGAANDATIRVLAAEGCDVVLPPAAGCCGALALHAGVEDQARRLAKATISAFEGCDAVAVNAAGCGSAMKDYAGLLGDDPSWAARAEALSSKTRDISELLAELGPAAERHPVPLRVAYHDACHLAHAQRIRAQPRALLQAIPELVLLEPKEWEICCGSAGIYNLLEVEAAGELGRRKAANLMETGAEVVAAGNPGCALQIAAHLRKAGHPMPVVHPVELLDASIRGVPALG